jgi:putative FmdB family regulatory protein
MPLYEYKCEACDHQFERIQKFSDPPIEVCPACGGRVRKLLSTPAIQFKGTGWYITDYAKKPTGDSSKGSAPKDGKSGDGKAADASGSGSSTSSADSGSASTASTTTKADSK